MAKQTITTGNSANDGSGDPARTAFTKTNNNFSEIYQYLGDGSNLNKLGTAAFKNVGKSAGDVMEVGAFGVGSDPTTNAGNESQLSGIPVNSSIIMMDYPGLYGYGTAIVHGSSPWRHCIFFEAATNTAPQIASKINNQQWTGFSRFAVIGRNATIDSNGFIKSASPIVQLFAEYIELNEEAAEQDIAFKKINVGHYLIKGSSGFAQEGWYIETPKDANGNTLFAVNYQQLENGDIEVKTYKKKFDIETASIIADLENPIDITEGRWIDIRLQEIPKQIPEYTPQEVNTDEPQQ